MSADPMSDDLNAMRLEEAADWLDRFDSLTPAERTAFGAWRSASASNGRAFDRMRGLLDDPALTEAAAGLARGHAAPLARPMTPKPRPRRSALAPWAPLAGLAAAAVGGVIAMSLLTSRSGQPDAPTTRPRPRIYASQVGLRRDAILADRSVLHLDADSRVSVAYSAHSRALNLERGEAMFEVTHDPARPFDVRAGEAVVTAVGTVFDVDLLAETVEVRVYRGAVNVSVGDGDLRRVRAGEWLILAGGRFDAGRFRPDLADTWRSNWLQADNTPLWEVVARLNRYSRPTIVLGSSGLDAVRLTGRFDLSRPDSTVAMIARLLDLDIRRDGGAIRLARR